jgi:hypothetical protein
LILVVSATDFRVTQSVIIDSSNNTNHFRFYTPDFQKPIKQQWFEFNEKQVDKTYRIVDADQQQQPAAGSGAKKP